MQTKKQKTNEVRETTRKFLQILFDLCSKVNINSSNLMTYQLYRDDTNLKLNLRFSLSSIYFTIPHELMPVKQSFEENSI